MTAKFDKNVIRYAGAALAWIAIAAAVDGFARRFGLAPPPWWSALGLALGSVFWLQHRLGPANSLEGMAAAYRRLLDQHEGLQRRLAAELHDEMGQLLTVLKLRLRAADDRPPLIEAEALVDALMACVRDLSVTLNPAHLRQLGLAGALRAMVQRLGPAAAITLEERDPIGRFDARLETAAFRVAQEAVTNALRHAGAGRIEIGLRRSEGQLIVSIRDDGAGFDAATAYQRGGVGLLGMRERAVAVGGRCEIRSSAGAGTYIELRLPFTIPGSPE